MPDKPEETRDQRSPASSTPVVDSHIYCLRCDYDLTGLAEDRCPECGLLNATSKFIAWQQWGKETLSPVELPAGRVSLRRASLWYPGQLGKRLPPGIDLVDTREHVWLMRGCAAVLLFLSLLTTFRGGPSEAIFFYMSAGYAGLWAGSAFCERAMAGMLAQCARATYVPEHLNAIFWRALTRCFATYLPVSMSVLLFVLFLARNDLGTWRRPLTSFMMTFWPVPSVLWWWISLGRAFTARAAPGARVRVALVAIPVVAVIALVAGLAVAALCMVVLTFSCSGLN